MNHEIRKLQILNDLIAQTLDVIQQRTMGAPGVSPFVPNVPGLSHTPYNYPVAFGGAWDPRLATMQAPYNGQLQQQPWTAQNGLSHTGFDPRFQGFPTYQPQFAYGQYGQQYGVQQGYGYPVQNQQGFGFGLQHTPVQMNRNWNVGTTQMVPGMIPQTGYVW